MSDPKDFADTPEGWASRWKQELDYAARKFGPWQKKGEEVVKTYLDQRITMDVPFTRLNLFNSNITTLKAMLYGDIPKVDVARRYFDPNDDVARVASEMLSRLLNQDLQKLGQTYSHVMRQCLEDRLLPGCGQARMRYDCTIEETPIAAVYHPVTGAEVSPATSEKKVTKEWTETCYVPWLDYTWSPCRFWAEMRWQGFRTYFDKSEMTARFGEEIAKAVPYNAKSPIDKEDNSGKKAEMWNKCEVWELWHKANKTVYWYSPGYSKTLDQKVDPLEIEDFWPSPPPMFSNLSTGEMIPVPDFVIAQDLYKGIDTLQERIQNLTEACKVVGIYDKTSTDKLSQLLKPGTENQMIPVDNWAMFSEKGGIKGVIDFLPLEMVVNALDKLIELQDRKVQQLYEVTGMAEILRGGGDPSASATQDTLKAKFGSIRIQALQDEFARFATDLQKIKYEIIARHYDEQTIIDCSNMASSPDGQNTDLINQAVQLLKDPDVSAWKIEIRPESIAMTDYAQIRQERSEYINAVSLFMQSAAPLMEGHPEAAPVLMELLKWGLAGFKGSNSIEGVLDQAISAMTQKMQSDAANPQPPPPDPKLQAVQAKAASDKELATQKHGQDMEKMQAQFATAQTAHEREMERMTAQTQAKMSEMIAMFQVELTKIQAQTASDLLVGKQDQKFEDASHAHKMAQQETRSGTPNA